MQLPRALAHCLAVAGSSALMGLNALGQAPAAPKANESKQASTPATLRELGAVVFASSAERTVACLPNGRLLYSTDGKRFQTGPALDVPGDITVLAASYGDGEAGHRFLFIGYSESNGERHWWRACTEDGTAWLWTGTNLSGATATAYGSGHWVVVGPNGLVESSHDSQGWQRRSTDPKANFTSVAWNGQQFIASASTGNWVSPDGLEWKKAP